MKLRSLALALTTATLLPAFAYACDSTDAIRASFDRAFDHESAASIASCKAPDQILASFERELYHEPAAFEIALVSKENDPLDAIFADVKPIKLITALSAF